MTSKLVGFRRFQYKRKSDGQLIDACNYGSVESVSNKF